MGSSDQSSPVTFNIFSQNNLFLLFQPLGFDCHIWMQKEEKKVTSFSSPAVNPTFAGEQLVSLKLVQITKSSERLEERMKSWTIHPLLPIFNPFVANRQFQKEGFFYFPSSKTGTSVVSSPAPCRRITPRPSTCRLWPGRRADRTQPTRWRSVTRTGERTLVAETFIGPQ